jgi:ubiquinone/menaquinone biosynthesis C-methylase UbiE
MHAEHFDPGKTDLTYEPELKSYLVPGLTTNGYPDYRWEHDFVLRQVANANAKPHKILDAGGGIGVLQVWLQRHGYEVHNADRDPQLVQKITAINVKFGTSIQPYATDLTKLPFTANFFDGLVSVSSLEHNKPEQFAAILKEMARVLRPGGYLALTIPVAATERETWDPRVHELWRWDPEVLRMALDTNSLTSLPSLAITAEHETRIARAYGTHRMIYPVGFFLRKRGW